MEVISDKLIFSLGNAYLIMSVFYNKKLQNWFGFNFLSMAFFDLIIGSFIMTTIVSEPVSHTNTSVLSHHANF